MNKAAEKRLALRQMLWPNISNKDLWIRTEKVGFTTIPRTITIIGRILDQLSGKGFPLFSTYIALWCHLYDEGFVEIRSDNEMAFESGFEGSRAASTWRNRMTRLESLGFIKRKSGIASDFQYILILNPLLVIQAHYQKKEKDILFQSLIARLHEIGANEITL